MRYLLWLLVLVGLTLAGGAQPQPTNEAAEKLAAALVAAPTETERASLWAAQADALTPALAQALLALGRKAAEQQALAKALLCFQLAERVADRNGDRKTAGQALNNQGVTHAEMGQYQPALVCHQKSLALRDATDAAGRSISFNNLGNA